MRLARSLVAAAILSAVLVWSTPTAGACSCSGFSEQQHFDRADVVFEGTVAEVSQLDETLAVLTLAVDGVYKGDARQTQSVYTHAQSSACGVAAEIDDVYLVFAQVIDGTETEPGYPIGDLRVDQCSGSRRATTAPDLDPPIEPVAPIADAPTTTTTAAENTAAENTAAENTAAENTAAENTAEPLTGGSVLVIGFIAVGVVGVFIASRIAQKSRES